VLDDAEHVRVGELAREHVADRAAPFDRRQRDLMVDGIVAEVTSIDCSRRRLRT
jgi:hypothetical protein